MQIFRKKTATDEALMGRLQAGDHQALGALYDRYSKPLLRYFFRMLWQDKTLAQDCLQDLFEKIILKKMLFDTSQCFRVWAYAMAYNQCKNIYRTHSRQPEFEDIEGKAIPNPAEANRHDGTAGAQIKRGLQALSEAHQTAFLLRYEQELSIQDIASIMECAEGTVKSRLFYAKRQLAQRLQHLNPHTPS